MKLRLIHKLLIALFFSTSVVLLLILWLAQVNIGRGFQDFLLQQERARLPLVSQVLADWYRQNGSWTALEEDRRVFGSLLAEVLMDDRRTPNGPMPRGQISDEQNSSGQISPEQRQRGQFPGGQPPRSQPPRGAGGNPPPPPGGPPPETRSQPGTSGDAPLHQRIFLLDKYMLPVDSRGPEGFDEQQLVPVEVGSVTVGWVGVLPSRTLNAPSEQAFAKLLNRTLLTGGAIGLMVAALLASILARHIGKPLTAAAVGVRELVAGNYQTHVEVKGNDETASLGRDINQLATTLSDHEIARQRWVADIAHELRTPLAIMRGEIEAMTDGVRELNEKNLASVHQEVGHLSDLVDDLHTLAMSDTGALSFKLKRLDMSELTLTVVESVKTRCESKRLDLTWQGLEKPIWIEGDEQRLRQLLHNLLENSIRYTDAPGRIKVNCVQTKTQLELTISDSSPGVSEDDLGHLFDRLFRVEASRNRNTGGSGLGLSICKNIVQAHNGQIEVKQATLGGISMTVRLPLS